MMKNIQTEAANAAKTAENAAIEAKTLADKAANVAEDHSVALFKTALDHAAGAYRDSRRIQVLATVGIGMVVAVKALGWVDGNKTSATDAFEAAKAYVTGLPLVKGKVDSTLLSGNDKAMFKRVRQVAVRLLNKPASADLAVAQSAILETIKVAASIQEGIDLLVLDYDRAFGGSGMASVGDLDTVLGIEKAPKAEKTAVEKLLAAIAAFETKVAEGEAVLTDEDRGNVVAALNVLSLRFASADLPVIPLSDTAINPDVAPMVAGDLQEGAEKAADLKAA